MSRHRYTTRFLLGGIAATSVAASLLTAVAWSWLQQPARAEVGAENRATGDYGDTVSDFVIPYEGYLTLSGAPLNGGIDIEFRLYEWDDTTSALSTTPEWTEQQTVIAYDGHFSVGLGATERINEDLLDAEHLYLELAIVGSDGSAVALGDHQIIEPVPWAVWSAHAANLSVVGGTTVGGTVRTDTLSPNTAASVGVSAELDVDVPDLDPGVPSVVVSGTASAGFLSVTSVDGAVTLGSDGTQVITGAGTVSVKGLSVFGDAAEDVTTFTGDLQVGQHLTVGGSSVDLATSGGNPTVRSNDGVGFFVDTAATASTTDDVFFVGAGATTVAGATELLTIERSGNTTTGADLQFDSLRVSGNNIDVDSGLLNLNRLADKPIRLHVDTTTRTVESGANDAESYWTVDNGAIDGNTCASGTRGTLIIARHSGTNVDHLCFCGQDTTSVWRWTCLDP